MSGPRIREALPADCEMLAGWAVAMARETEAMALDRDTVTAGIAAGLADPERARYFVAVLDVNVAGRETIGMPVGTLMITREWSDWLNGEWWWIQSVYVPEAHRRQGVFAALYRHAENTAREAVGVIGLRLYVEHENSVAQKTYESLGMQDSGYLIFESEFKRST